MPRQNVEFEFPDPDKDEATQEVEVDVVEEDAPLEVGLALLCSLLSLSSAVILINAVESSLA